ncbi:MAG: DoxX family protein [Parvibaculum sp.]|uniref:DoxX family protein n=1 Tax=Parvibaculum sp. TaxID=2024848 RepID=UPI0032ECF872
MNAANDYATLLGRIFLSVLFVLAGVNKAMGAAGTIAFIESKGLPLPQIVYAGTVALELGGGLLLLIGYQARLVALAFAIFCVAAAVVFHPSLSDPSFLKNFAVAGGMLYIFAHGAGRYSLDARRGA